MIQSAIRISKTCHKRFLGSDHSFTYDLPCYWLDIDVLEQGKIPCSLLSVNRPNLLSVYSEDYLSDGLGSIREKLNVIRHSWKLGPAGKLYVLTFPRLVFRNFNPVSFYYEVDADGRIQSIIAEVTNTYKDKHVIYIPGDPHQKYIDNRQEKVFHVSPFLPDLGTYHFRILNSIHQIEIHIRMIRDGKTVFYANLIERKTLPMTTRNVMMTTLQFPLGILGTMPRILWHAAILNFKKKQKAARRPIPLHPDSIRRRPPTRWESICLALVIKKLSSFSIGSLELILPDGQVRRFGTDPSIVAQWRIEDYSVVTALVINGEIGMGETYVAGEWRTDNLTTLLTYFLRNRHHHKTQIRGTLVSKSLGAFGHWLRRNTVSNSKSNIQAHYDLSNEMYRTFLDDQMNYSSAIYTHSDMTLEDAQITKLDRLISALHIQPTHHVLEIGSGWGAAAIRMAQTTGCSVTTLTLSTAQFDHVQAKINSLGLGSKITVLLEDYREHTGVYDRILSIEMIEAVGHKYLQSYFESIDGMLKPNGIVAIQAITIPDQRYSDYLRRIDWIQKHIFPGGHLPSLSVIQSILADHTQLIIERTENIGPHYAVTLAEWRSRFLQNRDTINALGFDEEFIRKWTYYFSYCEAGFANRYINTLQIVLTRPVNLDLISEDRL